MKKAYRASTVYTYGNLVEAIQYGFAGDLYDGHFGKYFPG